MSILTILIIENIFLLLFGLIWFNRHCRRCQKVKCLEKIFNQTCQDCQNKTTKRFRGFKP